MLYQLGVYRGVETLTSGGAPAQKVYWNVALGVRRPAIAGCWLRTRATADDALATPLVDHGVIAAGAVYPYVQWDVDLSACVAEALTFGDPAAPVRADYTGTGDGATAFAYGFGPSLPAGSLCTPACEHGGACLAGTCDCTGTGWGGAVCATPLASCLAIRDAGASFGSGLYTIDPDGAGGADPVEAWCDMDADGGGWTLVLHATRPDGTYFASNYSNYVPMGIDTAATPTPSVEGRKLNALADVPFTQVAALSIDGAPFVPNCVWDARSDLGYRINANNWSIKADGVPYVGLQALANDCYGANYGATGVTKNYASAGVGATYNAIHTQWSNFMIVDDGLVTTSAESAATKGLSFAVYNAEYRYFSGESCTTGVRVGFDTAIIGVR
ncbi:MAG: hypothetical protein EP329_19745 [Deltaproteobacteria bacterium]|nr:MAG: hypothetical protein EP329_19745 [Deltaproteobacteria bacterium]